MNDAADPGAAADPRQEMALTEAEVAQLLPTLPGWVGEGKAITKIFRFRDHYETMAFVNALAWISHRADHHPDLAVGYNECKVSYTTHWLGGLGRKDFACAAKADALFLG
jgi:4a-hydroxytetrahydrobiopterin dehydratase